MFWSFHPVAHKTNDEHLSKPFCTKIALKELINLTIKSMSRRLRPNSNVELFIYRTQSLFAARKWCKFDSWFIRRAQFIFTMYNGVQRLSMKINYSNLWIRFRRLKRRRTTFETLMCIYRTKFMDQPKFILGDPGADSWGRESLNGRKNIYGTKKSK